MPSISTHIVPNIDKEASGPSYSVPRLCNALQANGNPTKLATLDPLPSEIGFEFTTAFPYGAGPKRLGFSPKMSKWLQEEASTGNSKILHNHSLWMMTNVYPANAIKNTSCKLVISPRGTLSAMAMTHSAKLKKILGPILLHPALTKASAFHATSQQEYLDIRALGLKQPIAILPNGIDLPTLEQKQQKPLKRLLYLGRIHPLKGIENLLHAWKEVQHIHKDWELVITGPGDASYLHHLHELTKKLDLQRCEFSGPLYGQDKLQMYCDTDIYVLPTHTENFGMTVAEALAAGTPCIVTKGAPWEGLESHNAGWWIDIGVAPLTETLKEALKVPPETLEGMGQDGRAWMEKDFSWNRIAINMSKFYEWLLGSEEMPPFVKID